MRIDSLKSTPDRMGRYWVKFSNGDSLGLYKQTVQDHGLYAGKELSDAEFAALMEAAGKMSAKMRAVRIVTASSVSKGDLEQRLVRKGEDPKQAREAVEWMEDLHLIDDREMAHNVVRRCISKGYGLTRAKQALYEKRVPKQYWEEALENYPDQFETIMDFLQGRLKSKSDEKEVRRAVDALLRRGHSWSVIRRALNQFSFDTEEFQEE